MSPIVQAMRADIRQLRLSLGVTNTQIAARTIIRGSPDKAVANGFTRRFDGERIAGIEYWVGGDNAYAWVIRNGVVSWHRLGGGRQVADAARRFHASLTNFVSVPMRERLAAAQELHRLVMAPLKTSLSGASQLVIVPDGPLHFVPFAALRSPDDSRKFLVEEVSIVLTPAFRYAPRDGGLKQGLAGGRLLLVADPIYEANDQRRVDVTTAPSGLVAVAPALRLRGAANMSKLVRLTSTAREAAAIKALFAAHAVDEVTGVDAVRDAILARDLSQYKYLHLATHGVMDAEIPAMSALILGAFDRKGRVADQQVRVGDLLTTTLDADLVVLCACDTSLGPSFPEEGPLGLRYAVLARGARMVVSSLWSTVDDRNADLMTDMYGRMVRAGERADVALAGAMRTMLDKKFGGDPAMWAPYTVYIAEK